MRIWNFFTFGKEWPDKKLEIPADVVFLFPGTFAALNMNGVSEYTVAPDNPRYTAINGALFTKDLRTLVAFPPAKNGEYTVPTNVRHIAPYAFCQSRLDKLKIPKTIDSISRKAFDRSPSLGWDRATIQYI